MGAIRTTEELLRSLIKRVRLLERRLAVRGAGTPASRLAMTGEMKMWPTAVAPDGWVLARGQSLLRSDYVDLFNVIGETFGAVDGAHFSLPDLRGRVPVGQDSAQVEFDALGEKAGAKTHTLIPAELAPHTHTINSLGYNGGTGYPANRFTVGFGATRDTTNDVVSDSSGGGAPHNNLQPYIVLNYIIKS